MALIVILTVGLVLWGALPEKMKAEMLSVVWKSSSPSDGSPSDKIAVAVTLPSGVRSADFVIKTEAGQEVVTITFEGDERQTIYLPSGSYTYELRKMTFFSQSGPPECYEYEATPTKGQFKVDKLPKNIQLPTGDLKPIPNCTPSATEE